MALSARMLALIQKIESADAAHFASLRASAKRQSDAHAKTLAKETGEPPPGASNPSAIGQDEAQTAVRASVTTPLRRCVEKRGPCPPQLRSHRLQRLSLRSCYGSSPLRNCFAFSSECK